MNYDIKSLTRISLTLDMNFSCDLGESIQDNDTFMRGSCLSYEVRNVIVCYQTKRLPSDMLYVHENVVCCFSILASLNSQSEVLQMLSVCAVLTRDVPECLVILPPQHLTQSFMLISRFTWLLTDYGGIIKMIEIKVTRTFSVGEGFFIFSCAYP